MNALNLNENVVYIIPNSLLFGSIALGVVGLSIFLKRNIWSYLFMFVIIASFFPALSFTNFNLLFFVGSIKFDVIGIVLLVVHLLLNPYIIRKLKLSRKEQEESTNEAVSFFVKQFERKTNEELLRMKDSDLLPEAIEAKRHILEKRCL